jgi:archaellum component FlaC
VAETNEGLNGIEQRLGSVEKQVTGLRGEVGGLRDEVGGLRGEVGGLRGEVDGLRGDVGGLRGEVQKLRVLFEHTASDVKLLAEVQGHHSNQLAEIAIALEPLREMHAFFKLVAGDHEHRIKALEGQVAVPE